jgi:hypothetical protein
MHGDNSDSVLQIVDGRLLWSEHVPHRACAGVSGSRRALGTRIANLLTSSSIKDRDGIDCSAASKVLRPSFSNRYRRGEEEEQRYQDRGSEERLAARLAWRPALRLYRHHNPTTGYTDAERSIPRFSMSIVGSPSGLVPERGSTMYIVHVSHPQSCLRKQKQPIYSHHQFPIERHPNSSLPRCKTTNSQWQHSELSLSKRLANHLSSSKIIQSENPVMVKSRSK